MKVRLNVFYNAFLDLNMCNGFNWSLSNDKFVEILDNWIEVKPNIMADEGFRQNLALNIESMMMQYFDRIK